MAKRKGLSEKAERPADILFQPTEEKGPKLTRATYYITEEIQEAIRIMAFKGNDLKSELVRTLLYKAIPEEILEEAKGNLDEQKKEERG